MLFAESRRRQGLASRNGLGGTMSEKRLLPGHHNQWRVEAFVEPCKHCGSPSSKTVTAWFILADPLESASLRDGSVEDISRPADRYSRFICQYVLAELKSAS
jgi:hypothetical protein